VNLHDLIKLSIDKIGEQLDELTREQIEELRALESAAADPRSTLLKRLDAKLAELDEPNTPKSEASGAEGAAPAKVPAWQLPNYVGPLTGDQALWRSAQADRFAQQAITK
jgi:hypothetical protein